jgi:hypothetical protein
MLAPSNVTEVESGDLSDIDVLVVGAPTHAHGLPSARTRTAAATWADDPSKHVSLDPFRIPFGIREWLDAVTVVPAWFAAFDTRADVIRLISGSAGARIERRLRKLGSNPLGEAASFLIDDDTLETGELSRATRWGRDLATAGMIRVQMDGAPIRAS